MSSAEPAGVAAAMDVVLVDEAIDRLYAAFDAALTSPREISAVDEVAIQRLLTLAVKLYVARREAGADFSPFLGDAVTGTDVSLMTMAMLKAINLDLFELSLWRHWGRA